MRSRLGRRLSRAKRASDSASVHWPPVVGGVAWQGARNSAPAWRVPARMQMQSVWAVGELSARVCCAECQLCDLQLGTHPERSKPFSGVAAVAASVAAAAATAATTPPRGRRGRRRRRRRRGKRRRAQMQAQQWSTTLCASGAAHRSEQRRRRRRRRRRPIGVSQLNRRAAAAAASRSVGCAHGSCVGRCHCCRRRRRRRLAAGARREQQNKARARASAAR